VSDPRWCPDHGRLECTRAAHGGRVCHGSAVRGADRCRMHLGKQVETVRREQLTAWAATPWDGDVTPAGAVAGQLGLAWRRAALLAEELRRQAEGGDSTPAGLAAQEAAERERVVRFAEAAHRMGVQETQLKLSHEAGMRLTNMLRDILEDLGHDAGDAAVRAVVRRRLQQILGSDGG
jgi:hypothetical protein